MVSQEQILAPPSPFDATASPRISFSAEFLDEKNFISITPKHEVETDQEFQKCEKLRNGDFEFLKINAGNNEMLTADELFFEGKLIPFWKMQLSEKLNNIILKAKDVEEEEEVGVNKEETRVNWFVDIDDDPSPRPPKCTVLWKELLRLKKQRASALSPSSSSSSSSSSSLAEAAAKEQRNDGSEKNAKKVKKGLDRTGSTTIGIRPMVNVPICTQMKSNSMIPLFPPKKGKVER